MILPNVAAWMHASGRGARDSSGCCFIGTWLLSHCLHAKPTSKAAAGGVWAEAMQCVNAIAHVLACNQ